MRSFVLALAWLLSAPLALAQTPSTHNETYLDPELDVDRMAERFETESREVFALRAPIVGALAIAPGSAVADIGAGTGAFLDLLVGAVGPQGHLFAVDIAPGFVERVRDRAIAAGYANVTAVLGATSSATLPPQSIDLAFVCDTYHHFDDPAAMLASLHAALRPGGRLVIVDFDRVEGVSRPWILEHVRASKEQFAQEIVGAGFEREREIELDGLVDNFILVFRRP